MIFRGVHGTCYDDAVSILAGLRQAKKGGRAGTGFYLWAFEKDKSLAEDLAMAWHMYAFGEGKYGHAKDRSCAYLEVHVDINPYSFLNIENAASREEIRAMAAVLPPVAAGQPRPLHLAYDAYFAMVTTRRLANPKVALPLKLVGATVSLPGGYRDPMHPLTIGANAYIVLAAGIPDAEIVDVYPSKLRALLP